MTKHSPSAEAALAGEPANEASMGGGVHGCGVGGAWCSGGGGSVDAIPVLQLPYLEGLPDANGEVQVCTVEEGGSVGRCCR